MRPEGRLPTRPELLSHSGFAAAGGTRSLLLPALAGVALLVLLTVLAPSPAAATEAGEYIHGVAIDSAVQRVCVLRSDGAAECAGSELGTPPSQYLGYDAVQISLTDNNSCALTTDRNVTCWTPWSTWRAYSGGDAAMVAAGFQHTCVLTTSGNVRCTGGNSVGQRVQYDGGDAIAVNASRYTTCVLFANRTVSCFGENSWKDLQGNVLSMDTDGSVLCLLRATRNVDCLGPWQNARYTGGDAVQVAVAFLQACFLTQGGNAYCINDKGQLSLAYGGGDAVQVSAGFGHRCVLKQDQNVTCSGQKVPASWRGFFGITAQILPPPEAPVSFRASPFQDGSVDTDGNPARWRWRFGDGLTSPERNPSHAYNRSGTYTVTLEVWDNRNAHDEVTAEIVVTNPVPEVRFNPSNPAPSVLDSVSFVDESRDNGLLSAWRWNFGDGGRSTERNPTHRYMKGGLYQVALTVVDSEGAANTTTRTIQVFAASATLPGSDPATAAWPSLFSSTLVPTFLRQSQLLSVLGLAAGEDHTCILTLESNMDCYGNNAYGQAEPYRGGAARQVVAGLHRTCLLDSAGSVQCQGDNTLGAALSYIEGNASGVATGAFHTCILLSDGAVTCQGENTHGQAEPYLEHDATAVAAGREHTCILRLTGSVVCQGLNAEGQATGYPGRDAVAVVAGTAHTCVLTFEKNVKCFGSNSFGQTAAYLGRDARAVATGAYHTCVLRENGNVKCWGANAHGQAEPYLGGDATGLAAGTLHTCVSTSDSNVKCWGDNREGQATNYDTTNPPPCLGSPLVCHAGTGGASAQALTLAYDRTCVLTTLRVVHCYGGHPRPESTPTRTTQDVIALDQNGDGSLACVLTEARDVECYGVDGGDAGAPYEGHDAIQVALGYAHRCILLATGNVDCTGDPWGGATDPYTGGDALQLSVGGTTNCVLRLDGTVHCWGESPYGAVINYPVGDALQVSTGSSTTCIVTVAGNLRCWGWTPLQYNGGDAIEVTADDNGPCILTRDGNVTCWESRFSPARRMYDRGDAIHVESHWGHACALTRSGEVRCWGENFAGQSNAYPPVYPGGVGSLSCSALEGDASTECVLVETCASTPRTEVSGLMYTCAEGSTETPCDPAAAPGVESCRGLPDACFGAGQGVYVLGCATTAGRDLCLRTWYPLDNNLCADGDDPLGCDSSEGVGTPRCTPAPVCNETYAFNEFCLREQGGRVCLETALAQSYCVDPVPAVACDPWSAEGPAGSPCALQGDFCGVDPMPLSVESCFESVPGETCFDHDAPGPAVHPCTPPAGPCPPGAEPCAPAGTVEGTASEVAVNWEESCFLVDGSVLCQGGPESLDQPPTLRTLHAGNAVSVAAGGRNACVLDAFRNVTCYERYENPHFARHTGGDVLSLSVSDNLLCLLLANGNAECKGYDSGYGAASYHTGDAVGVAAGSYHSCILTAGGNVRCEGNTYGGAIADYAGGDAVQVAAGYFRTCAILQSGNVRCWGEGIVGMPLVHAGGDVLQVALAETALCLLTRDGNVTCDGGAWGADLTEGYHGGDAVQVAVGPVHACVLTRIGTVHCWGYDQAGSTMGFPPDGRSLPASTGPGPCADVVFLQPTCAPADPTSACDPPEAPGALPCERVATCQEDPLGASDACAEWTPGGACARVYLIYGFEECGTPPAHTCSPVAPGEPPGCEVSLPCLSRLLTLCVTLGPSGACLTSWTALAPNDEAPTCCGVDLEDPRDGCGYLQGCHMVLGLGPLVEACIEWYSDGACAGFDATVGGRNDVCIPPRSIPFIDP